MYFDLMKFHILNSLQPFSQVPGTAVHGKCLVHNTRAEISMGTQTLPLPERRGKGATEGCTRKKKAHLLPKWCLHCKREVCY